MKIILILENNKLRMFNLKNETCEVESHEVNLTNSNI